VCKRKVTGASRGAPEKSKINQCIGFNLILLYYKLSVLLNCPSAYSPVRTDYLPNAQPDRHSLLYHALALANENISSNGTPIISLTARIFSPHSLLSHPRRRLRQMPCTAIYELVLTVSSPSLSSAKLSSLSPVTSLNTSLRVEKQNRCRYRCICGLIGPNYASRSVVSFDCGLDYGQGFGAMLW
jgi:hypothetical protein